MNEREVKKEERHEENLNVKKRKRGLEKLVESTGVDCNISPYWSTARIEEDPAAIMNSMSFLAIARNLLPQT